jgi:hypothetical protein
MSYQALICIQFIKISLISACLYVLYARFRNSGRIHRLIKERLKKNLLEVQAQQICLMLLHGKIRQPKLKDTE